ncbi:hypothetical protein V490_01849 [Pseudogymnoascus sp. VKM F-3557]|nr:hypothetical protein V490_01849 [Pseudogymnoascus sp. VKM F-3557]
MTESTTNAIEEETYDDYNPAEFYPAHIGEVIKSPRGEYRILGKLGFGRHSTVWLCREAGSESFYTLKIGISHPTGHPNREADIYTHLQRTLPSSEHEGRAYVRRLHEAFELDGPDGKHWCLVHPPLGVSMREWQETFPGQAFPVEILRGLVRSLLLALDCLHEEGGVIHTDIQATNILLTLPTTHPLDEFAEVENSHPSAHKTVDDRRTIYRSRRLSLSSPSELNSQDSLDSIDKPPGVPTLTDFGLAVQDAHAPHAGVIQPLMFRAPEVILRMPWDGRADIWNLGVLMWQLKFDQHLFNGETEGEQLRHMIAALGMPPSVWKGEQVIPHPLGKSLEGEEEEAFLDLLKGMVRWVPEERKSARELLEHPWLARDSGGKGDVAKATGPTAPIEEEKFTNYKPEQFYPARIGDILESPLSSYEIVGKLGFGRNSTVWLCQELRDNSFYTIKIGTTHIRRTNREAQIYDHLRALPSSHIGRNFVHIQARNILISLADDSPLQAFVAAEQDAPSARKVIDERRTIYASRPLAFSLGEPTLCDFGLAVMGPGTHEGLIQPLPFRAPEVILGMPWDAKVDIWNLGTLLWQLSFNTQLFSGATEVEQLARMIAYLGPPPREFVAGSNQDTRELYFDKGGGWKGALITPTPIGDILEGEEVESFLDFLGGMLAWAPGDRKTARELLRHSWLRDSSDDGGEQADGPLRIFANAIFTGFAVVPEAIAICENRGFGYVDDDLDAKTKRLSQHGSWPKLAAVSFWYEFYYDVVQGGQYTFEIGRMHEKYGPVIRINPHELHVSQPDFYEKLYSGPGKRRHRWGWYTAQFGLPESMFGTTDHDSHRIRRAAVNPFFSKGAVRSLQPIIDERIEALLNRFRGFQASGQPITLDYAFSAYTNDIAQEYAFARSDHRVDQDDFEPTFHKASIAGSSSGALMKQYPWVLPLMQSLPESFMTWLDPDMASYFSFQNMIKREIQEIKSGKTDNKSADHRTIFYEIINSDLPPEEKSDARLAQDGQTVVIAGTITTAWGLCVAVFHLLSQPETLKRLKEELRTVLKGPSSPVTLATIEQLPYLTGCVQECIRLSYGVCTRLQRIAPDETLTFNDGKKDWYIPPGTPVGMTSVLMHHDESVFPDSRTFLPERWIGNPQLSKYLISFSKGTRQCIGINLAYAELYIALARIFRAYGSEGVRFEDDVGRLELFETTMSDLELTKDVFIPVAGNGSKGIRVLVKK